ncbi:quinol-cytochrome oxidoreductase complex cytochrome b subunit [Nocardia transvalensis]|uniref:Cytochrome bc1 complex cytochrome b subunit n=1 Tax=Nocardia transvalensis TaxID=37333 RepID=A0A7W9PJW5_9NOCA|nr:quinol-cytochrome oxidoreductase complex cytochrome b subunit [Nocardia transvalensis]
MSTVAGQANAADERYHLSAFVKRSINKVFPTHWSFLLGEIALYSFIILLLTGVYLTLFFDPSMTEVVYNGSYQPLRGVTMSRAFESALDISFEVRGGLFVRQVHHWAALLFSASMIIHLFRIFFTGAFRKPREANWVIGSILLIIAMFEGFFGYSLPDDLLSGTGLRAAFSGITMSIPVIGTWLHWLMFGGDFPGDIIIPRLYIAHVLLFPGIMLALIAAHVALVWYQKHTQFPGPGRTEKNVIGARIVPVFAADQGAFFMFTLGVLAVMGGVLQINPIWNLGPYNPSQVSAGTQPDFYLMWYRRLPAPDAAVGAVSRPLHDSGAGLGGPDHGAGLHGADRLPVDREATVEGYGAPQSATAAAGRAGAHRHRRHGRHLLSGADAGVRERHHLAEVRHLAQRDDVVLPHRAAARPAARLLPRLSAVPGPAAQ